MSDAFPDGEPGGGTMADGIRVYRPRYEEHVEKLFSYGTLRDAAVQHAVFGRTLEGTDDALVGYRLVPVRVQEWAGATISGGDLQQSLVPADGESVSGTVLHVSDDELRLADSYEPREYKRVKVRLRSGTQAWVYLRA